MTNASAETSPPTAGASLATRPELLLRNASDDSQDEPQRFVLTKFCSSIGREPHCDLQLKQSNGVSRLHAQVFVIDGEVVIEDLGSRNGTFVNAKLLRGNRQTTLKDGDVITIGKYKLKLVNQAARVQAEARAGVQALMSLWNAAAVTVGDECCPLCKRPDAARDAAGITADDCATETMRILPTLAADARVEEPARVTPAAHGVRFERDLPRRARQGIKRLGRLRPSPLLQAAVAKRRLQRVRRSL